MHIGKIKHIYVGDGGYYGKIALYLNFRNWGLGIVAGNNPYREKTWKIRIRILLFKWHIVFLI